DRRSSEPPDRESLVIERSVQTRLRRSVERLRATPDDEREQQPDRQDNTTSKTTGSNAIVHHAQTPSRSGRREDSENTVCFVGDSVPVVLIDQTLDGLHFVACPLVRGGVTLQPCELIE